MSETATDKREEERAEEHDGLSLSIPLLGGKLIATGKYVVFAALVGCLVYLGLRQDDLATASQASHRVIAEAQKKTQEKVDEMVYVLTLSPEKREALKLEMPDSLRQKIRRE